MHFTTIFKFKIMIRSIIWNDKYTKHPYLILKKVHFDYKWYVFTKFVPLSKENQTKLVCICHLRKLLRSHSAETFLQECAYMHWHMPIHVNTNLHDVGVSEIKVLNLSCLYLHFTMN